MLVQRFISAWNSTFFFFFSMTILRYIMHIALICILYMQVYTCLCVQINAMTLSSTFTFAVPEENLSHSIVDTEFYFSQKKTIHCL